MFMWFQGGGVGHLGTHCLDSRLKKDNHTLRDEQQDKEVIDGIHNSEDDSDHCMDKEQGNGMDKEQGNSIEEDPEMYEEHTGCREHSNKEGEEEDKDKDKDKDKDTGKEQEVSENVSDKQDLDDKDKGEGAKNDAEILDEEGYADLWVSMQVKQCSDSPGSMYRNCHRPY